MVLVGEVLDRAWQQLFGGLQFAGVEEPTLFSAVILLVLGIVGGRLVGEVVRTLLAMTSLDDLAVKADVQQLLRRLNYRGSLSDLIADAVTWLIYLLTVFAIFSLFGFQTFLGYSDLLLTWAARGALALAAIILGTIAANHLEALTVRLFRAGRVPGRVDASGAEIPVYAIAGRAVKYIGVLVTLLVALGLLGIDPLLLNILIAIFGIGIVAALVFGARDLFRNIGISIYVQLARPFREGDHISLGETEGEIAGIRPLYTKLESGDRTLYVPNTALVEGTIEHEGE